MSRKRKAGRVRLEDIKIEGGIVVSVYLIKGDGAFFAEIVESAAQLNKSWTESTLEAVKKAVYEWAKTEAQLKWEPVILVAQRNHNRYVITDARQVLNVSFRRMFRAPKIGGDDGYVWRCWSFKKGPNAGFVNDDDLGVYDPGGNTSSPFDKYDRFQPIIFPYTPERWSGLMKLVGLEKALHDRLAEIVAQGGDRVDELLVAVQRTGLQRLMGEAKSPNSV